MVAPKMIISSLLTRLTAQAGNLIGTSTSATDIDMVIFDCSLCLQATSHHTITAHICLNIIIELVLQSRRTMMPMMSYAGACRACLASWQV